MLGSPRSRNVRTDAAPAVQALREPGPGAGIPAGQRAGRHARRRDDRARALGARLALDDAPRADRRDRLVPGAPPRLRDLGPAPRRDGRRAERRDPRRVRLRDPVRARRERRRRRAVRDARMDERERRRDRHRRRQRAAPRDGAVHGHRELDGHPRGDGRRALAGRPRRAQPAHARPAQPVPGPRDRHDGRRVPGPVRQRLASRALRTGDGRGRDGHGHRDPRRRPHRRGRARRRRGPWPRGACRGPGSRGGRCLRGPRVGDHEGPDRGVRPRGRGRRPPRAQGDLGRAAPVPGDAAARAPRASRRPRRSRASSNGVDVSSWS